MKTSRFVPLRVLALALLLLLALPLGQAFAADITVDADCSLANAIRSANGDDLVEPLIDCEAGDAAVDAENTGVDTITIDAAGTADGEIWLDETLSISTEIVIEGGGFTIDGRANRVFDITAGSLTIGNLTLTSGYSVDDGGAIRIDNAALRIVNSVVKDSGAQGHGGGIYATNSRVELISSVISGNVTGFAAVEIVNNLEEVTELDSENQGGDAQVVEEQTADAQSIETEAVEAQAENGASEEAQPGDPIEGSHGGGIYVSGETSSLTIEGSGLDNNVSPGKGGGLYIASGSANISDSTISQNHVSGAGGGVYNEGNAVLTHVTVLDNTAIDAGGVFDNSQLQLYNSILYNNAGGDCAGSLNANIGNIIRDGSCNHDGITADPALLLLAGSPAYYLPREGSPAIDAGSPDHCTATDQRGIERQEGACDIGAAEFAVGVFDFQIQSALAVLTPGSGGGSADDDEEDEEEEVEIAPTAVPSTCASLPPHITLTGYNNGSSVNCKIVDYSGLHNQTLVNGGALHAVDIFGWVAAPFDVCFQRESGALVLLDAANSPRNIVPLRTWTAGDKQCASIDRTGTAVLMPLSFFTSGAIDEPMWDLSGCTVTTTDILNLRHAPTSDSNVAAKVLNDVTLDADRRATFYYRVDYYGIVGWLSKDYLSYTGTCF